jgi:hypothetical protein
MALNSGNTSCCTRRQTVLLAHSNPLVTAGCRTLVHAECT